jgi:hypothetical protein
MTDEPWKLPPKEFVFWLFESVERQGYDRALEDAALIVENNTWTKEGLALAALIRAKANG